MKGMIMSAAVVWIDHRAAKIFRMSPGAPEIDMVKREGETGSSAHAKATEEKYFHELAQHLNTAKQILIIGPGNAKQEFMSHLEKHHHQAIAKNVVGVETVDHPSENQILEHARTFFRKFDLFAG